MITPRATYRLQFRNAMTFARAAELAPYLARLGVSHLYASPIFAAAAGSTHGYDTIDMNLIEPSLGGEEGFRLMAQTLREHDIGILLDFVPNHMGASPSNGWWRDVLEWGAAADHAQHFDIDWSAPKLIVPALAVPYGVALEHGDFSLALDAEEGTLSFSSSGLSLPLTPPSYAHVLAKLEGSAFHELARRFAVVTPETSAALKAELAAIAAETRDELERALKGIVEDRSAIHALHELQAWRLAYWRSARETLTYRRFFEIADLVGVNVERPRVFEDVHATVFQLMRDGLVHGLRLDHIDGLADPREYLQKLSAEAREPYLVVEKILGANEVLRSDWPVAGTTGYEFITALSWALVDETHIPQLTKRHEDFARETAKFSDLERATKRRILSRNFAGELERLKDLARAMAERHLEFRDLGADTLRRAIIELIASLDIYRTYVSIVGPSDEDRSALARAAEAAKQTREIEDEEAINFLVRLIELDFAAPEDQAAAYEFATRFQQTSGPIMAKAIEDTVFYRFNPLIGLNEVGGHPGENGHSPADFHAAMEERRQRQPAGLSATSTHDTKRGEDARARLYVLSEMPDAWADAVERWSAMLRQRGVNGGSSRIEPDAEWLFYQTLLAAWPADLKPSDARELGKLSLRVREFMLKAAREAKIHTSWTAPDTAYEETLEGFVVAALDPGNGNAFLADFHSFCQPIFVAGALNGLSQTLIKLTAPGVPDIYQGSEVWNLSLVDPDNRRAVDFGALAAQLSCLKEASPRELVSGWRSGALKLWATHLLLRMRQGDDNAFAQGAYVPLDALGPAAEHVISFARVGDRAGVVVVAPRLCFNLLDGANEPFISPQRWRDTEIILPTQLSGRRMRDVFTGALYEPRERAPLGELLNRFPAAVLASI